MSQKCKLLLRRTLAPGERTVSEAVVCTLQIRCSKTFVNSTGKHLCWSLFFNKTAGWKPEIASSSCWRWSVKEGVLKTFANFTEKNLYWSLFLIRLEFWGPATLLKKTPTQMHPYEICKLFNNNYFEEHLWTSTLFKKRLELCILWIVQEHYFVEDLRTADSKTPVRGSLFNKIASLTAWRLWTVLERDCRKGIFLWILTNFSKSFFAEHVATTSHMMLFLFLFADQWGLQPKISLFRGAMLN